MGAARPAPQVDLTTASIRPGRPAPWLGALRDRVQRAVRATGAEVTVLTGTWQHDLDQVNLLPQDKVRRAAGPRVQGALYRWVRGTGVQGALYRWIRGTGVEWPGRVVRAYCTVVVALCRWTPRGTAFEWAASSRAYCTMVVELYRWTPRKSRTIQGPVLEPCSPVLAALDQSLVPFLTTAATSLRPADQGQGVLAGQPPPGHVPEPDRQAAAAASGRGAAPAQPQDGQRAHRQHPVTAWQY